MRKPTEQMKRKQDDRQKRKAEQAAWLRKVMQEKGLLSTKWSLDAGLTRATISRTLNPKYKTLLMPESLIQLAHAAGVPPPFELAIPEQTLAKLPSAEVFCHIIKAAMDRLYPGGEWTLERLWPLAQALRVTLLELQADPRASADLEISERMVRAAIRMIEPENSQDG